MCDLGQVSLSCTQSTKIYRAPNTYCSKRRSQTQICLTCSSAFFPHTELCPEKASTEMFKAWRWAGQSEVSPSPTGPLRAIYASPLVPPTSLPLYLRACHHCFLPTSHSTLEVPMQGHRRLEAIPTALGRATLLSPHLLARECATAHSDPRY